MQPTGMPLLILLVLAGAAGAATEEEPLACYSCTMTPGDDSCYSDPASAGATPVVECLYGEDQCCMIRRMDAKADLGTPVSFARLCTINCDPKIIGKLIDTEDYNMITYDTYCDDYLCNNGPGNVPPGSNSGGGNFISGIAGDTGAATALVPSALLLGAGALAALRR